MKYFPNGIPVVFALLLVCSVARCESSSRLSGNPDVTPGKEHKAALEKTSLAVDFKRLESFKAALKDMAREMDAFRSTFTRREKGYFSNKEHDLIEQLLFRYLICRESLWEMINFYQDYPARFTTEPRRTRGFLIGYSAGLLVYHYSARLVHTFLEEPLVRQKLNEDYYRSEIPAGTYDMLFQAVTNPDNLQRMAAAWQLFVEEIEKADSELRRIQRKDSEYGKIISEIYKDHRRTEHFKQAILDKTSILLPKVRNALRHSEITRFARSSLQRFGTSLYAIRGLTFTKVSRLRNPMKARIHFTDGQLSLMKRLMQPGDIILTMKSGYMSNIFLPGVFKHGITYVGSPSQRGLDRARGIFFSGRRRRFRENIRRERIEGGYPADIIEAVAEGVIFNSIEKVARELMSRIVAFRPRLSPEQRRRQLTTVFRFLGSRYDFKFDFNDASYQCCTEVMFRSLNGLGPVHLNLTPRMGRQTLSAEDLCRYALDQQTGAFDFIFLAIRDETRSDDSATILQGLEGIKALKTLFEK